MRSLILIILLISISCSNKTEKIQSSNNEIPSVHLMEILDTIWETEQTPIRLRDSLGKVYGYESEEFQKQNEEYHKNHDINEKKIIRITISGV